jgi:hypothetical protein
MFIPDPDLDILPYPSWIPDLGVKKASDHGFGSATLLSGLDSRDAAPFYLVSSMVTCRSLLIS